MKPLFYLIIVDVIILLIFMKLIFGKVSVFIKAILGHIFSDFDDLETFKRWDKENDIKHKINLFYAIILGIGIISFVIPNFWF